MDLLIFTNQPRPKEADSSHELRLRTSWKERFTSSKNNLPYKQLSGASIFARVDEVLSRTQLSN